VIAWPRRGRLWLLVGQVACLAAIVLAGRASAERPASGGQGAWVAVAVAAAVISAAGNGIWLAVLRRVANGRRQLVFARLASPAEAALGPADVAGGFVMVSGLTLRHRPDCPLVAGKSVVPASPDARPCGWCLP
jgi:drug/metabolite transporter (DMT)-like permease